MSRARGYFSAVFLIMLLSALTGCSLKLGADALPEQQAVAAANEALVALKERDVDRLCRLGDKIFELTPSFVEPSQQLSKRELCEEMTKGVVNCVSSQELCAHPDWGTNVVPKQGTATAFFRPQKSGGIGVVLIRGRPNFKWQSWTRIRQQFPSRSRELDRGLSTIRRFALRGDQCVGVAWDGRKVSAFPDANCFSTLYLAKQEGWNLR